jgi:hypothetical protein
MSAVTEKRARLAALTRRRPGGDPDIVAAQRDLRAATAEAYIARLLDATPPLTAEQKLHLTRLLTT